MIMSVSPSAMATVGATSSSKIVRRIRHPNPQDILCGRGGACNNHPGNVKYRQFVNERKADYFSSVNSKEHKSSIAKEIVQEKVQKEQKGRFLTKDETTEGSSSSTWWVVIDDAKAISKTLQALREGRPRIRTTSNNSKSNNGMEIGTTTKTKKTKAVKPAGKAARSTKKRKRATDKTKSNESVNSSSNKRKETSKKTKKTQGPTEAVDVTDNTFVQKSETENTADAVIDTNKNPLSPMEVLVTQPNLNCSLDELYQNPEKRKITASTTRRSYEQEIEQLHQSMSEAMMTQVTGYTLQPVWDAKADPERQSLTPSQVTPILSAVDHHQRRERANSYSINPPDLSLDESNKNQNYRYEFFDHPTLPIIVHNDDVDSDDSFKERAAAISRNIDAAVAAEAVVPPKLRRSNSLEFLPDLDDGEMNGPSGDNHMIIMGSEGFDFVNPFENEEVDEARFIQ